VTAALLRSAGSFVVELALNRPDKQSFFKENAPMAPGPSEAAGVVADADRIHLLVDAVTEYAIYMLNPDGLVTSWNAGAEQLKGYGPAEIIGQPYERFFTREDQQRNLPLHILATAKEAGRHESEGWRVCKDGVRFLGSVILHRVQDKAGRHIGFVQVTP
jgi:PAS domain S-box-containing protein